MSYSRPAKVNSTTVQVGVGVAGEGETVYHRETTSMAGAQASPLLLLLQLKILVSFPHLGGSRSFTFRVFINP